MEEKTPNYRGAFFKSPHHIAFALLTLGAGFLTAAWLPLIAGATAYTLGWLYLPDLNFFKKWVDRRNEDATRAAEAEKVAEFLQKREVLLRSLSPDGRQRYNRLALVCRDIEQASADNMLAAPDPSVDPRLRKLDELMWTFLRLLGIEESLRKFLDTEAHEKVPELLKAAEEEGARLTAEIDALKAKGNPSLIETKQRYLGSRMERLEVLRKRQQRSEQAQANLALVVSEQERLDQQIKLIRADAVATKNAETLTARIDATVQHLDQTNKWLSELDEFKDLVGDIPSTEVRVGYEASSSTPAPRPPVIETQDVRRRESSRQRQLG